MRMKKTLALALALGVAGSASAFADNDVPGTDWMPKDKVVEMLSAAGYTNITGLEADDGHWEGKGVKAGKIMEFHVDPHTGTLLKEEIDH